MNGIRRLEDPELILYGFGQNIIPYIVRKSKLKTSLLY